MTKIYTSSGLSIKMNSPTSFICERIGEVNFRFYGSLTNKNNMRSTKERTHPVPRASRCAGVAAVRPLRKRTPRNQIIAHHDFTLPFKNLLLKYPFACETWKRLNIYEEIKSFECVVLLSKYNLHMKRTIIALKVTLRSFRFLFAGNY